MTVLIYFGIHILFNDCYSIHICFVNPLENTGQGAFLTIPQTPFYIALTIKNYKRYIKKHFDIVFDYKRG